MTTDDADTSVPDEGQQPPRADEAGHAAEGSQVPVVPDAPDASADDGTLARKQIHRWKGEGGALHPDD